MLNKKRLKLVVSKKWLVLLIGIAPLHFSNAQKLAIKSNVLSDLTLSPNLGLELVANSKLSFGLNYTFRPSDFPLDQMSFTVINPHMKYWFQRPLCRFFIGLDVLYIDNDIKIKDTGYVGDCKGGGLFAGYDWVLSNHWNLEVSLGCGVVYANQYKYEGERGQFEVNYKKWLPVPTSCSVSFIYIIK